MAATADLPAMLDKYRGQLGAVIQEVAAAPAEREPDYRLAHLEAAAGAGADDAGKAAAKIRLVAERKAYGIAPKKGVAAAEDASVLHIWRWEVVAAEAYFGDASLKAIKAARAARGRVGKKAKALGKLVDALVKGDAAKALAEEEKVLKISRDEDAARLKAEAADRKKREKEAEKKAKEDAKALKKRESEDAKAAKKRESEDAREASAAKKKKVDDGASSASKSLMGAFLKKAPKPPAPRARASASGREPRTRGGREDGRLRARHRGRARGPAAPRVVEASSAVVTATAPFAKDPAVDYDYDSDDDYAANEGEIEDGEDLSDDDGEKSEGGEEDALDYGDDFLEGDDELDDGAPRAAKKRSAPRQRAVVVVSPLKPGEAGDDERERLLAPYAATFFFDPDAPDPDPDPEPEPKAKKPRKPKKSAEAAAPAPAPAAGAAPPAAAPDKPASSEKKRSRRRSPT
ncbi:hypothetical protein JL721_5447 [Aureococcus anophagefferens]|nr:hypothetical protein JL721_5447 [Aureococcus anophagefferens]